MVVLSITPTTAAATTMANDETNKTTTASFYEALHDLEQAEDNILRVLEIASKTCEILQDAPLCDHDEIEKLATEYNDRLMQTYKLIHQHSNILEQEPILSEDDNFTEEIHHIDELAIELWKQQNKQNLFPPK
jgi:hypothetical protein